MTPALPISLSDATAEPKRRDTSLLTRYGAPAISLAVLGGAFFELHKMDWAAVLAMVPRTPLFWMVFVIAYSTPVLADWLIYRRLWQVPLAGVAPMLRKTIGNELLFGYVGEAYLYTWARRSGQAGGAAFGSIKDVAILSAAIGGIVTVSVAIAAAPYLGMLQLGIPAWSEALALCIILAPPVVASLLRGKLFTLPTRDLRAIAAIHACRATGTVLLTALLWHLALPTIALFWWLVFAAVKLLISRLPVSNKELVFAGAVTALLGRHADAAALMTMLASLLVATHVVLGIGLSLGEGAARVLRRMRFATPDLVAA